MRIAFLLGQFPALSETFILSQIVGLAERGHEIRVFAHRAGKMPAGPPADVTRLGLLDKTTYFDLPGPKLKRLAGAPGQFVKLLARRPGTAAAALNVPKYKGRASSLTLLYQAAKLRNERPFDIVHAHFGPMGIDLATLASARAIVGKTLCTFHGHDATSYIKKHGSAIYRLPFKQLDGITVNSAFIGNKVVEAGCPKFKVYRLPVSLDLKKFTFAERTIAPGERVRFLTVGRLVEKKGIEYSIAAFKSLIDAGVDAEYRIVGGGAALPYYASLVAMADLGDRLKLLGPQDAESVRREYAAAHVFVLASVTDKNGDMEGQGLVLQEAQAMGLPVISTYHNGIPEGVVEGQSALLVPERDAAALTVAMRQLADHPERWPAMGRAGRTHAEKYDVELLTDRCEAIYAALLGRSVKAGVPVVRL